jgi:hypothetical protein
MCLVSDRWRRNITAMSLTYTVTRQSLLKRLRDVTIKQWKFIVTILYQFLSQCMSNEASQIDSGIPLFASPLCKSINRLRFSFSPLSWFSGIAIDRIDDRPVSKLSYICHGLGPPQYYAVWLRMHLLLDIIHSKQLSLPRAGYELTYNFALLLWQRNFRLHAVASSAVKRFERDWLPWLFLCTQSLTVRSTWLKIMSLLQSNLVTVMTHDANSDTHTNTQLNSSRFQFAARDMCVRGWRWI